MGAIISKAQFDRVMGYIDSAKAEGARLIAGGGRPSDPALAKGLYIEPTVFADVKPAMKIAREEILSALRLRGIRECDRVAAVVLETDGEFSVLPEPPAREIETLVDVDGAPAEARDRFNARDGK